MLAILIVLLVLVALALQLLFVARRFNLITRRWLVGGFEVTQLLFIAAAVLVVWLLGN